ncbi:MAG: hypothetical protein WBK76_05465 [Candidatus Saccharimonadales bacterium]
MTPDGTFYDDFLATVIIVYGTFFWPANKRICTSNGARYGYETHILHSRITAGVQKYLFDLSTIRSLMIHNPNT